MNKLIQCYAPLDSLYDYRRGLIQKWITRGMAVDNEDQLTDEQFAAYQAKRKATADNLWEIHIEKTYKQRRMDVFEYPFFQLNRKVFDELYNARTISDFGYGYYPSQFMQKFLKVVLDYEQLTELPIAIKGVVLHINVFPYKFDDAAKQDLIDHCKFRWGGRVDVKVMDVDDRNATGEFYKQFNYVFKYDLMLSADYKRFFEAIPTTPIPNVTFIIPDLLVKETTDLEGPIADRLVAQSLATGASFKALPVNHLVYDYE